MIVDDDPAIHRMIGRIPRARPYNLVCFQSGAGAIESLPPESPDLILLGLSMPHMDGFEVAERIRGYPETSHIPIIILTGNNSTDLLVRTLGSTAKGEAVSRPSGIHHSLQTRFWYPNSGSHAKKPG